MSSSDRDNNEVNQNEKFKWYT